MSVGKQMNIWPGVALLTLCVFGVASLLSTTEQAKAADLRRHAHRTLSAIESLRALLVDTEAGQHGFIITGDERFRESYRAAEEPLRLRFRELRELLAGNPRQQRLNLPEPLLLAENTTLAKGVIALYRDRREAAPGRVVSSRAVMDRIRQELDALAREQQTLPEQRESEFKARARAHIYMIALGSLLALVLVTLSVLLIRRSLAERDRARQELQQAYDALESRVRERTDELAKANIGLRTEIAERRRTEEALRQSEEQYRTLIETTNTGYVIIDSEGRVIDANAEYVRLTGHETLAEIRGRQVFEWTAQHDLERNSKEVEKCARRGMVRNLEIDYAGQDGVERHIEINASVIDSPEGPRILGLCRDITQRKRAEEALRASEERFALAALGTNDGIWDSNLVTGQDYFSDRWWELLGYEPHELPQSQDTWVSLLHPDDRDRVLGRVIQHLEQRVPYDIEYRLRTKGGEYRWFRARGQAVWDESGVPVRMAGAITDTTQRRQVEKALLESRARLSGIVNTAMDAIITVDDQQHILLFNAAAERLFLCSAGEALGQKLDRFIPERFDAARAEDGTRSDRTDVTARYMGELNSLRGLRTSGEEFPIEASVSQIESAGRKFYTVILRDITARMKAEAELRRQALIFENLTDAIIVADLNRRIVDWNPAAERMFGYTKAEVLGLNPSIVQKPEDRERLARSFKEQMNSQGRWVGEVNFVRKDGSTGWCETVVVLLQDEQGRTVARIGVNRDITERRAALEQLRASQEQLRNLAVRLQFVREEERTRIAREIHDELGGAMTGLKIDLAWLACRLPPGEMPMLEKCAGMRQLINSTIQSVRRIATELRPGVLDDFGLNAAIEWLAQDFQKRSGIACEFTSGLDDSRLDRHRETAVFRICQETLTNVIRHAQATKVSITIERKDNHLVLSVRDNGRGVTSNELARPESLGIVGMRERALVFGGELQISGEQGQGTTVTVRLPLEKQAARGG
ncbi:MAG TPA: PAS domain S-box protein [Blastocatellia bacterium]|nr:PAS domain S-box protein [Blastocatellia bacterium]